MNTYDFTIRLDRAPDDEGQDRLDEAGLDDSSLELAADGRAWLVVTREAASLEDAILSAIDDIRRCGYAAVGIRGDDLVTLADIARRTDRTPQAVRLLATGRHGGGDFPAPVADGLYPWTRVRAWFADREGTSPTYDAETDTLAVTDLLLRATALRPHAGRLAELVTT